MYSQVDRYEVLWTPEGAESLRAGKGHQEVGHYVEGMINNNRYNPLYSPLDQLAWGIEPYDSFRGVDPKQRARNAFNSGAAMGMELTRRFLSKSQRRTMADLDFEIEICFDVKDPKFQDIQSQSGDEIVEVSEFGWMLARDAYEGLFEEWIDDICTDVTRQEYVRRGFGAVVCLASLASEVDKRAEINDMLDDLEAGSADFDDGLEELLR